MSTDPLRFQHLQVQIDKEIKRKKQLGSAGCWKSTLSFTTSTHVKVKVQIVNWNTTKSCEDDLSKCNCTCKLYLHRLNLHTVVNLKVGAAGVRATYSNNGANLQYQNTFVAVTTLAFETSYTPG